MLENLKELIPADREIVFVCIGTDRSTGDSYGPLVGKALKEAGVPNVYGDLDDPVHAMNLAETLLGISRNHAGAFVIGVDACLGQVSSVGTITAALGPIKPGAGIGKTLPPVGDMHIIAIVNVGGFMEYFVLQNTRLSLVMKKADQTTEAILQLLEERSLAQVACWP